MGTWGSISITGEREGADNILLQTSHDGFSADTLEELLRLPVSIYEKAKWETENLYDKYHEDVEPSRLARYTRAFFFHDMKTRDPAKGHQTFEMFAHSWFMMIPLDICSNSLATYLMWQRCSKWHVTSELAWEKEEADVELIVTDDRCPDIEFICDCGSNSEEYIKAMRDIFDDCIKEYPLDALESFSYFDVMPKFEVVDETTVKAKINIDLVVAALLWQEIEQLREELENVEN